MDHSKVVEGMILDDFTASTITPVLNHSGKLLLVQSTRYSPDKDFPHYRGKANRLNATSSQNELTDKIWEALASLK